MWAPRGGSGSSTLCQPVRVRNRGTTWAMLKALCVLRLLTFQALEVYWHFVSRDPPAPDAVKPSKESGFQPNRGRTPTRSSQGWETMAYNQAGAIVSFVKLSSFWSSTDQSGVICLFFKVLFSPVVFCSFNLVTVNVIAGRERCSPNGIHVLFQPIDRCLHAPSCKALKWYENTRSLGAPQAPTSSWRPFRPLDFVLRAFRALRL